MKTKQANPIRILQDTVNQLSWSRSHWEASARLALSKAAWLGLSMELALAELCKRISPNHLQENPGYLLTTWCDLCAEIYESRELTTCAF